MRAYIMLCFLMLLAMMPTVKSTEPTPYDSCVDDPVAVTYANLSSSLCNENENGTFCWQVTYQVTDNNASVVDCRDHASCEQVPCQYGGDCVSGTCECLTGFTGHECTQLTAEACVLGLCLNGATCGYDAANKVVCKCAYGYGGVVCENKIDWTYLGYATAYKAAAGAFGGLVLIVIVAIFAIRRWAKKRALKAREHYEDIPKTITNILQEAK